ncbi:hypothetical protein TGMAS_315165 [Toxoplasma gondii MAS]|uniref:Uncharacterized protein n=1 Tax=Toxoplasma gondii MAS TaxID=943118 RepID=A0A086R0G6_TOXGO|nr:hypothetical protein TGMAS_315165 [Toxoplasma gondii MAS]
MKHHRTHGVVYRLINQEKREVSWEQSNRQTVRILPGKRIGGEGLCLLRKQFHLSMTTTPELGNLEPTTTPVSVKAQIQGFLKKIAITSARDPLDSLKGLEDPRQQHARHNHSRGELHRRPFSSQMQEPRGRILECRRRVKSRQTTRFLAWLCKTVINVFIFCAEV